MKYKVEKDFYGVVTHKYMEQLCCVYPPLVERKYLTFLPDPDKTLGAYYILAEFDEDYLYKADLFPELLVYKQTTFRKQTFACQIYIDNQTRELYYWQEWEQLK